MDYLRMLCADGIIKVTERGNYQERRANRYRYCGGGAETGKGLTSNS